MLSGIFTGLLIAIFLGIVAWAYNSSRSNDFSEAEQLPLESSEAKERRR